MGSDQNLQRTNPALSLQDCAAFILAQSYADAILLTGDRRLRGLAEQAGVECHGVLWAAEEIAKAKPATRDRLIKALEIWRADPLVRLPKADLDRTMRRLKRRRQ